MTTVGVRELYCGLQYRNGNDVSTGLADYHCIATRGVAIHLGTIVNEQKKKFQLSLQQDNFLKFKILRIYIFSMVDNQSFC